MLPSACADLVGPVAVALSGGLDSAMALVLLHEAGYQVTGVTMRLLPDAAEDGQETADVASARAICARYGIDHHLVDLSDAFSRQVIASFVAEYGAAQTPNPASCATRSSSSARCWSMCRHWACPAWPRATM